LLLTLNVNTIAANNQVLCVVDAVTRQRFLVPRKAI
jgi:hypothetical protein